MPFKDILQSILDYLGGAILLIENNYINSDPNLENRCMTEGGSVVYDLNINQYKTYNLLRSLKRFYNLNRKMLLWPIRMLGYLSQNLTTPF